MSNPWKSISRFFSAESIFGNLCLALASGTVFAFLILLLFPLIKPDQEILKAYIKQFLPWHTNAMAIVISVSLLAGVILITAAKLWRSVRLGLLRIPISLWTVCVLAFWLLIEANHRYLALISILSAPALTLLVKFLRKSTSKSADRTSDIVEDDLPLGEDGKDLLGRQDTVDTLVSRILFEQPLVIAVTAPYGYGKTSFLNLLLGKMRRVDVKDLPIIVKFSPWLAADSNTLILSLLNSIVSEMRKSYVVPGLKRDAFEYARTLLSAIPKAERLKDILSEPSQEGRIAGLAKRISKTNRRVLVVLDDLDRMEGKEVETVFKLLRGSETFLNFTFVCAFDRTELICLLRASRPFQNIDNFIEKFFQLLVPLPKIDSAHLQDLFMQRLTTILARYSPPNDDLQKSLSEIWGNGAGTYFQNPRRIKLFLNKISHSLERIGAEVNVRDFVRLELVRDIAPTIYEEIYLYPENFYDTDFAFEARFAGRDLLDDSKGKDRRAKFYNRIMDALPDDKQYVSQILEDLFPHFAAYKGKFGRQSISATEAEEGKRLFHPRYFRQYFLLKVPSELFSQKEFDSFLSTVRNGSEEETIVTFNKTFRNLEEEDFKRWHFVHRIENVFDSFGPGVGRGLCRGLAQNSSIWSSDAFEFMIAVRCTRAALEKIKDNSERQSFLERLIRESTSTLYALLLVEILEKEARDVLPSDLQIIYDTLKRKLRERYLISNAPSVFEELKTDLGRIEPIQFLLAWKRLGPDGESGQRQYLLNLFTRRPTELNWFLRSMFRIDYMDDYTALKQLIDYDKLNDLIDANVSLLDSSKVEQFKARYNTERGTAG